MKCAACGHEEKIRNGLDALDRNSRFVSINGHFTMTCDTPYGPERQIEVAVYACPNCGTLKANL